MFRYFLVRICQVFQFLVRINWVYTRSESPGCSDIPWSESHGCSDTPWSRSTGFHSLIRTPRFSHSLIRTSWVYTPWSESSGCSDISWSEFHLHTTWSESPGILIALHIHVHYHNKLNQICMWSFTCSIWSLRTLTAVGALESVTRVPAASYLTAGLDELSRL